MKRFMTRGAPSLAAVVLVTGFLLAACAPTGGGGGGGATTTSVAPTTSVVSGPHQCSAGATGTVTLGQNPIVAANGWPATNLVSVCWNFGAAGVMRAAFVSECFKPADAVGFDFASDCAPLAQIQVNGTSNPTGSGKLNFNEFRGAEPSGDDNWGIFATGQSVPAGITRPFTTGYIRVTLDTPSNNSDAKSVAFTFAP